MADTERNPAVHADDSVCPAHKDMLTRRDAMWFVGVLVTVLSMLGVAFFGSAASADRVERNERDIRDLRGEVLTEIRALRADIARRTTP